RRAEGPPSSDRAGETGPPRNGHHRGRRRGPAEGAAEVRDPLRAVDEMRIPVPASCGVCPAARRAVYTDGMSPEGRHATDEQPPGLSPRAASVHVPFCAHHCGYCDFAVAAGQDDLIDPYLDALAAELATLGSPRSVQTLFLGGGTPTHLAPAQLDRLLA